MDKGFGAIKGLSYTYPKGTRPVLDRIKMDFERGEFIALMGPTGAGKTTLCLTFNGIIPHFMEGTIEGDVYIAGMSVVANSIPKLVRKVGLVFQDPETQIFGITVEEDTSFGPCNFGLPLEEVNRRVQEALAITRLSGYEKRETGKLSGGEKQRLAVAGIMAMHPDILVLDEPTSELDPIGRQELFSVIKKLREDMGRTILMVEHDSEEVARCADRILVLQGGRIVMEGEPREIFSQVERLREIGIQPPQICELAVKLKHSGVLSNDEPVPITVEEACDQLKRILKKRKRKGLPSKTIPLESIKKSEPVIQMRGVWHVYRGGVEAVRGIDLDIYEGDFLAIIGQNGSGKTTLVKHFNGLLRPTKGKVLVKGEDSEKKSIAELSRIVGYVFQNPDDQIFATSVREEIAYGLRSMGLDKEEINRRIKRILRFIELEGKEDECPFNLGKGERQKLAVGSILAMEPEVLVIDEPTTGLDMRGIDYMMDLIKELHKRGHTIVIITHNMSVVADYATRVIIVHEGKILLEGNPRQVFSKPEVLKKSYLRPPQITRLAQALADYGIPGDVLNVEEMYSSIVECLR